ncbi:MAG: HAMP domain-containing protein [Symploca sp. SIO2B6]|nr:HAMP domain-containing protein [Symploca sp. SIO2B6]
MKRLIGTSSLSLRSVLVVPFLAQIFLAVGITGWLSLRNGQRAVDDVAMQLQSEIVTRVEQHIQNYLKTAEKINDINATSIQLGLLDLRDRVAVQRHFWNQIQVFGEAVGYIYIGYPDGGFDMATREEDGSHTIQFSTTLAAGPNKVYGADDQGNQQRFIRDGGDYDSRSRPWFQGALETGDAFWASVYLSQQAIPALGITASLPVHDTDGEFLGIVANDIYLSAISDFLQDLTIGQSGKLFIVEQATGLLVGASTADPIYIPGSETQDAQRLPVTDGAEWMATAARYLQDEMGGIARLEQFQQLKFQLNGTSHFLLTTPIATAEGLDWVAVVVVPEADFMAQIYANTRTTILLCGLALMLATGVGLVTSRWIAHAIQQVSTTANALTRGNLEQTVPSQSIQELSSLADSFNAMAQQLRDYFTTLELVNVQLERRVEQRTSELKEEQEKSERLLLNILPESIAEQLKHNPDAIAEQFEDITILFADIVGFTPLSARLEPIELVNLLNQVFSRFDDLADELGLEKIKTIGDAYMVAAGLPVPQTDHAERIAKMALAMREAIAQFQEQLGEAVQIRIGINTGHVVAGVIGTKKFIYDLWGDAVNVASRMESSGEPGRIQVTANTYERLKEKFEFEHRGAIAVKGKGQMTTYWLVSQFHTPVHAPKQDENFGLPPGIESLSH